MSRQFNTDELMVFPPDNGEPITLNAFESIECAIEFAIAFDVRSWSEDWISAWIYSIVFGRDDEEWDKVAKEFGWDEEDRKRVNMMHEQWIKAKEKMEQSKIVRCRDCKWYSPEISWCNNFHSPKEETFYCADGKKR